jgi:hypothetical protein
MEKELEKSREKEKDKAAQPGRAPACLRRLIGGPRLSAAVLPRSLPSGADLSAPVFLFPPPPRSLSLSLSCGLGLPVAAPLPRVPLSSLSAPWACPASSARSALAVDRRMRTRARRRISRPRRPPTRPAPFLEPRQCPAHTPCLISHGFTLSRTLPTPQPPPETRARVLGQARRRLLQASPSSAPR